MADRHPARPDAGIVSEEQPAAPAPPDASYTEEEEEEVRKRLEDLGYVE